LKKPPQLSVTKLRLFEKYVTGQVASTDTAPDAITPRAARRPPCLSVAQQELCSHEATSPRIPLYNESITIRMKGILDVEVLEHSFAELIRRHEIWRTTYAQHNGRPVQIIHPAAGRFHILTVDFRSLAGPERTEEMETFANEQARRPFDFERGPLLRASLLSAGAEDHVLLIIAHLSIVDGVSVYRILPAELAVLFEAFSAGRSSPLAELPVQFADFARWQRENLDNHKWGKQLTFWKKQLAGLPSLNWPQDGARRLPTETFRGVTRRFILSQDVTQRTKDLGQREGVTLFITLLAGFTALLHLYTGQTDIVIGTLAPSGRRRPELEMLLGHFINPVALRLNLSHRETFRELLHHVRKIMGEAIIHDMIPIETLIHEIRGAQTPGRNPFFNVGVSLQPPAPRIPYDWAVTSMDAQNGGARWDLYVAFIERSTGILGRVQYKSDVFEDFVVEQMWSDLQDLLNVATSHPEARVSTLLLRAASRA
jgi:hypothetical protein